MAMFSNDYQNEIAEKVREALDDGYTKEEVIIMLAEVISYFASV